MEKSAYNVLYACLCRAHICIYVFRCIVMFSGEKIQKKENRKEHKKNEIKIDLISSPIYTEILVGYNRQNVISENHLNWINFALYNKYYKRMSNIVKCLSSLCCYIHVRVTFIASRFFFGNTHR